MPFRVESRVVSAHVIGNDNVLDDSSFESGECLLEEIKEASRFSPELVNRALAHPDERVSIAIIERWHGQRVGFRERRQLYDRAIRTCQAENIVWHPLLDAMAFYRCWPLPAQPNLRHRLEEIPDRSMVQEHIGSLLTWAEHTRDRDAVKSLLNFRTYWVLELVGRHLGLIDEEMTRLFPLSGLANNPRLPELWLDSFAQQAVDLLADAPDWSTGDTRFGISTEKYALRILEAIVATGRRIPKHLSDRLVEAVGSNDRGDSCVEALMVMGPHVSVSQLRRALDRTPEPLHWREFLVHPSATSAFQWKILDRVSKEDRTSAGSLDGYRMRVATNLRSLTDRRIREFVLETTSAAVLYLALKTVAHAKDELFLEVFRRCVECVPKLVTDLVQRREVVSSMEVWVNRVIRHHLSVLVDGVVKSNNLEALGNLLSFEPTAHDPRIYEALLTHPETPEHLLRHLAMCTRGEFFRRTFARLIEEAASSLPRLHIILDFF